MRVHNNQLPQKLENFVIFQTKDGKVNIDVYFQNNTLWLSQQLISVLFEKDSTVIGRHLKNIFESGELDENDERLKQIKHFGIDYFEEMLERIREIRLSERRFYQKITDIYALSADYDSKAEIVYSEANATKTHKSFRTNCNCLLRSCRNTSKKQTCNEKSACSKLN